MSSNTALRKRSVKIIGFTLLIYVVLAGTHLGEFWPFSIYPMFSQAGRTWSRTVVQELPPNHPYRQEISWDTTSLETLQSSAGKSVALRDFGINVNDLANLIEKTKNWTPERINSLYAMFEGKNLNNRELLIYRVIGKIQDNDSVVVSTIPYIHINSQRALANPVLLQN